MPRAPMRETMMTQLSDTQLVVLSAACSREDRLVLPLPDHLRGGAASKVLDALARSGLIEEVEATKDDPIWRETGDGHAVTLVATDAALAAIGIAPDDASTVAAGATDAPATEIIGATPADQGINAAKQDDANRAAQVETDEPAAKPRTPRAGTKQAKLIEMLRAESGATIDEIVAALEWRPHTVRGALAGALKKKLGLDVRSEKIEGRGRVYQIG